MLLMLLDLLQTYTNLLDLARWWIFENIILYKYVVPDT
jgi:hypothetical protein